MSVIQQRSEIGNLEEELCTLRVTMTVIMPPFILDGFVLWTYRLLSIHKTKKSSINEGMIAVAVTLNVHSSQSRLPISLCCLYGIHAKQFLFFPRFFTVHSILFGDQNH